MMDFLMYAEDKQKKKKIKDSFTQMIKKKKKNHILSLASRGFKRSTRNISSGPFFPLKTVNILIE